MAVHMFHFYVQNFLILPMWDKVEKYCTPVQATADNIIRRMCFACSISSATDTHSPFAMIVAFGYMIALNGILDLHCCRVKKSSF
jgi:hypothetical protein